MITIESYHDLLPLEDFTTGYTRHKDTFFCYAYYFSLLYLPVLLFALFTVFVLVTFDVACLNSVGLKHIDCSFHFHELNCRGLNLNFVNLHVDLQRKLKYLKEHQERLIIVRALMLMLLVIQKHNMFSSMQFDLLP